MYMARKTILVVEDEALIALNQKQILERNGYTVRIAYNGDAAVELATGSVEAASVGAGPTAGAVPAADPIDLILMDIDLGQGIDGTEAARLILAHREIPVVFLSSHTEREIVEKTEEISSYGYVVKHSGETVLIASIRMAFRLYDARRSQEHTNDYLRTVLETLPGGFWVSDETGTIRDVNEEYCRISGFGRSELIGKPIAEIDEHDDEQEVIRRTETVLSGGVVRFRTRHRRKNGIDIPVAVTTRRVEGADQPRIVSFFEDLSTEEQLSGDAARSEQRFRQIMDSMQDIVFTLDTGMRHTGVYGPWVTASGLTEEHFLGKTFSEILGPEVAAIHETHFRSALEGSFTLYDWTIPTPDGTRAYQTSLSPIRDDAGAVIGVVGIGRDITDLRAVQSALDSRESFYTSLLEEVPGAVYRYRMHPDGSSCFPFASRGIETVYEVTPDEVREDASPVFRRLHPDDYDAVAASIAESMGTLTIWQHDYRVVLPRRSERWLRGRARPRRQEDGSVLWDGYITDITDMYLQRQETEALTTRFRNVIDGTNAGTWEWNVTTGETIFNDRWAAMVGHTLEELAPTTIETWTAFVHPEDLPRAEDALDAHFRGEEEHYQCEMRIRHKDGRWIWILDRGKVMSRDESGKPEWVFGTHQEITDQVHARERLERSEANFRAFFDTSIDYLWVLDATGSILDVNNTVTKHLGYTKEELLGRSVLEMHPPDQRDEAAEIVTAMLAGTRDSCPVPLLARDGTIIPVETYIMHATWNAAPALFGISRDISALALSQEKYAKMFDTSPALITLSEVETGALVDVNDAFCRALGFTRNEVIGSTSTAIIGLDAEFRTRALAQIETKGIVDNLETTITTRRGEALDVLLSAAVITVQDTRYTFTTAIDITERKRAERELERAIATERTLMAELNHRVKNNLAMVGSLIRLKDAELGGTADLGDIQARVEAITSLHEELQHAGGVGEVALDSYLGRVVGNVVANSSTRVAVTLDLCDRRVPTKIAVSLGLIINELATNAVKYGFTTSVPPELSVRESIVGQMCTITFTNSGNPFPEDVDLDNPTTMGLRLVSMLVSQISGTITLERTPKTTFSISFPAPGV